MLDFLGSATIAGNLIMDSQGAITPGTSQTIIQTGSGLSGTLNPLAGWTLIYLTGSLGAAKD